MKSVLRGWRHWLAVGLLTSMTALDTCAATLHVWQESTAPAPPYDSWPTAARTIQDAVDAAAAGDVVLVTNGVYAVGGRAVTGILTNRVIIQKAITVRSVNGPDVTIIKGAAAPGGGVGDGAIRCVYLGGGAVLEGLTLTEGHTLTGSGTVTNRAGGGAFCENKAGAWTKDVLTNCVVSGNGADYGGGVHGGSLYSCKIVGNQAIYGGGAYDSELVNCRLVENAASVGGGVAGSLYYIGSSLTRGSWLRNCVLAGNRAGSWGGAAADGTVLYNCTITGNSAGTGGGVSDDVLGYNCVVFYNQAPSAANQFYSASSKGSLRYSCTVPLPAGVGNIDSEPQLASATHLQPTSPCIGTGSILYASGVDIDGQPWAVPPCIGADQVVPGPALGTLSVAIRPERLQTVTGQLLPQLEGQIEGKASGSQWDFGDGTTLTNLVYEPFVSHAWSLPGTYLVKLTAFNADYPAGVVATSTVEVVEGRFTLYVNAANPSPAAPYRTWATAAQTINDAIQAALPGGTVLVTNGVYNVGERNANGVLARVVIDKPLRVQSVNGPSATVIQGPGLRCAYVRNGALLTGFTLMQGGGVVCDPEGVVSNCVIVGNAGGGVRGGRVINSRIQWNTASEGGGVHSATVVNSVLADNWASGKGGGAVSCILSNCTVVGNLAGVSGGGVLNSSVYNSIIYHNSSPTNSNYAGLSDCRYSCTTPLPVGEGNIADEPALASILHLSTGSPCIGAGSSLYISGVDIGGEPWATPPCIGADQVVPENVVGPLSVEIAADHTRFADGFETTFRARIEGRVSQHVWDFGDGSTVTNVPSVTHAWATAGQYEVRLIAFNDTTPEGVATSIMVEVVSAPAFYVNLASTNPVYPYVAWETAATNIQEAIDASVPGRRIWVANGVYESGSRLVDGVASSSRVVVDRAVRLESVNGPAATIIRGGYGVRGVYLGGSTILSGFTISQAQGPGGVWCQPDAVVTNCWLDGNVGVNGGGVYGGTLYHCRLSGNQAYFGAGAYGSILYDCLLTNNAAVSQGAARGGGVAESTLYRCTLVANQAHGFRGQGYGGGAFLGKLYNCLLQNNSADFAGGAGGAELYSCTVVSNTAEGEWWINHRGGGIGSCKVWNTIIYYNNAAGDANYDTNSVVYFSCTTPLPVGGVGNIDSEPGFVDRLAGNFHLLPGSPCIDTGTNLLTLVTTDLDGTPRPLDGNGDGAAAFDMGAYEYLLPTADSNGDGIPDGWMWQHGLNPTDPTVAMLDPDMDGILTGQEWIADTDPTNAASLFRIDGAAIGPPVTVTFLSSSNRLYSLESRANLDLAAWTTVAGQTGIAGNGNLLSLVHTNSSTAAYYRVGVRLP